MEHLSKLFHCLLVQLLLIAQAEGLDSPTDRTTVYVSICPAPFNLARSSLTLLKKTRVLSNFSGLYRPCGLLGQDGMCLPMFWNGTFCSVRDKRFNVFQPLVEPKHVAL